MNVVQKAQVSAGRGPGWEACVCVCWLGAGGRGGGRLDGGREGGGLCWLVGWRGGGT